MEELTPFISVPQKLNSEFPLVFSQVYSMNHHVGAGRVAELVRTYMGQCKVGKPLTGKTQTNAS